MVHHNRINLGFEDMENAVECGRNLDVGGEEHLEND